MGDVYIGDPAKRFDCHRIDRLLAGRFGLIRKPGGDPEKDFRDFERSFAAYIGRRHAVLLDSGTRGLEVSLDILGIGREDKVLLPNITHPALLNAVVGAGARPVLIDVRADNLNINENAIASKGSLGAKCLLMVHMFGNPCAVGKLREYARAKGLKILEDSSQALGVSCGRSKLGAFGDISVFSLSTYKPVSAPGHKAGILVCDDDVIYEKALRIRGRTLRPAGQVIPYLRFKLKNLDGILAGIANSVNIYRKSFAGCKGVKTLPGKLLQEFPLFLRRKDGLMRHMLDLGVPMEKTFPALSVMTGAGLRDFPVSAGYLRDAVHLPVYPFMTSSECGIIAAGVRGFLGHE